MTTNSILISICQVFSESIGSAGLPDLLEGKGTDGSGHVISLSASGQYGRIWLYKYHCLSVDNCFGQITVGSSVATGDHGPFKRFTRCSEVSQCSFT